MTERMVKKVSGQYHKPERPTCRPCRRALIHANKKRNEKRPGKPECQLAGKFRKETIAKMHLRQAPASGIPLQCAFSKRYFVRFFLGKSRNIENEQRAYLEATDEASAIAEARDWYTRALLHGAKWLPEDFTAERLPPDADTRKTHRILKDLRKKAKPRKKPKKMYTRICKRWVRVYTVVERWTVFNKNQRVRSDLKSREEAEALASELIEQNKAAEPPLPELLECVKCGKPPVWKKRSIVHEGDDYCPNGITIRDTRFKSSTKRALWNQVLRHGECAGWGDFRFEHVRLLEKIKQAVPDRRPETKDPLEGFEV